MVSNTQECLRELNKTMNKRHPDSDDDGDTEETENVPNLIIRNFSDATNRFDILTTILAQREFDMQKISKLEKELNTSIVEMERIETKLHYCRLDLGNSQIACQDKDTTRSSDRIKIKKLENINFNLYIVNFMYLFMTIFYFCCQ